MTGISVCLPVGPYPFYRQYLAECLESVKAQTKQPTDVIIVDDMAGLSSADLKPLLLDTDYVEEVPEGRFAIVAWRQGRPFVQMWRAPWRIGIPAVANVGVMLAASDLVFYLSCDDKLLPTCLEECWAEWENRKDHLGYYWVGVQYSGGETQALACGHAMIHKGLMRLTGGWPVESAIGACDAALISMMIYRHPQAGTLYAVSGGKPLYWHREHDEQYTKHQHVSPGAIIEVRDWFTKNWQRPVWGRYEP